MTMNQFKKLKSQLLLGVGLCSMISFSSFSAVTTTETQKYLVIATGEGTSGTDFVSFNMSNVELGADQEVVSNSSVGDPPQRVGGIAGYNGGLDLTGTWVPNDGANATKDGNRFNDADPDHPNDTVGAADIMPGARPLYEGIDYSGNVALTGELIQLNSADVDVNANIGIQCNRAVADCFSNPGNSNSYFAPDGDSTDPSSADYDPYDDAQQNINNFDGMSVFDPATLLNELAAQRDWIVGLTADTTWNKSYVEDTFKNNRNIKDSDQGGVFTDLDTIDLAGNDDGYAVIDIDMEGSDFLLDNTDWVLETMKDTLVIFRMKDGTKFDFASSSILLGDGTNNSTDIIDELGAIFFIDAYTGNNQVFNVNNAILGGIGLWDFTDFNPDRDTLLGKTKNDGSGDKRASIFNPAIGGGNNEGTVINLSDAQGCAQFISNQILMSNNRWNRCELASESVSIPEPSSFILIALALLGLAHSQIRAIKA